MTNSDPVCEDLARRAHSKYHKTLQDMAKHHLKFIKEMSDEEAVEELYNLLGHACFVHRCQLGTIVRYHEAYPSDSSSTTDALDSYGSPTMWTKHLENCKSCMELHKVWARNNTI